MLIQPVSSESRFSGDLFIFPDLKLSHVLGSARPSNVNQVDLEPAIDIFYSYKDDAQIVKATIRMTHDLDFLVTAIGIEYGEVSIQLQKLGCDKGQGYFYTKALPLKELNDMFQHILVTEQIQPIPLMFILSMEVNTKLNINRNAVMVILLLKVLKLTRKKSTRQQNDGI